VSNRSLLALVLLAAVACSEPADPLEDLPFYPGWFLSTVDGTYPPIPEGNGGSLLSAGLRFFEYTETAPGQGSGVVTYARHVLRGGVVEPAIVDLDFTIGVGILRINLCPRLSSCFAVTAELVGPVAGGTAPLVLTEHIGGQPGPVLRFGAALPD
jgi:hypothetical protein